MRNIEQNDVATRKHFLHLIDQILQMRSTAEIINHQKTAALEIFTQVPAVLVAELQITRLTKVCKEILEKIKTININDLICLRIRVNPAHFLEKYRERFIAI